MPVENLDSFLVAVIVIFVMSGVFTLIAVMTTSAGHWVSTTGQRVSTHWVSITGHRVAFSGQTVAVPVPPEQIVSMPG